MIMLCYNKKRDESTPNAILSEGFFGADRG
jgi:hypothetical protein